MSLTLCALVTKNFHVALALLEESSIMVAIQHYLCHAGNKEIFFLVWCYLHTFSIILISLYL